MDFPAPLIPHGAYLLLWALGAHAHALPPHAAAAAGPALLAALAGSPPAHRGCSGVDGLHLAPAHRLIALRALL